MTYSTFCVIKSQGVISLNYDPGCDKIYMMQHKAKILKYAMVRA